MYEGPIQDLIDELSRLPGIGPRGASRIAFYLLDAPEEDVFALADTLRRVKESSRVCEVCFNVSQEERCRICRDPRRDRSQLCVVEESKDVVAIERTNEFRGLYHVLGGAISPIDGIGPEQLHIPELVKRIRADDVEEIIIATNASVEGESTALFLQRSIQEAGLTPTMSRLARGIPVGVDLEYADQITLTHALEGRRAL